MRRLAATVGLMSLSTHRKLIMKKILASLSVLALSAPAWAAPSVPEIDAALSLQGLALAAGVAVLLKRKR